MLGPLLALLASWSAAMPGTALSSGTLAELGRIQAHMAASESGRVLLAETAEVPQREWPAQAGSSAVRFVPEEGVLAFDSRKLTSLTEYETQLALARELARASIGLPFELYEADMAAYQRELEFAVERAASDPAADERLRRSVQVMRKSVDALRGTWSWRRQRLPTESERAPMLPLPPNEVDRAAYMLTLFIEDPDELYWAVERGRQWPESAVRLTELEDFLRLHQASELPKPEEGAPYARVGGRRYRPAVVLAALRLRELGGLARLKESLGAFETRPIPELRRKANAWSRGSLKPS